MAIDQTISSTTFTITSIPEAGHRGVDNRDDFVDKQEAYQDHQRDVLQPELTTMQGQLNTLSVELEAFRGEANATADEINNSALVAQGASNYKGDWQGSYAGGYSLGDSATYTDGFNYISKINNNSNEPTGATDLNWLKLLKGDLISDLTPELGGSLGCNNKTFNGSCYRQIEDITLGVGTHTFNYSNGDMQQLTATGDITIAFSNFTSGKVCAMVVDAVNWGAYTITLPSGLLFSNGTLPSFTQDGKDRLIIIKDKDDIYSMFVVGQAIGTVE
jgi:hypothetical protein